MKGLIYETQMSLWGKPKVIGYDNGSIAVKEILRDTANAIIIDNHYSHKIYNASYIHLGVYVGGEVTGVLQYGSAMNPASGASVEASASSKTYSRRKFSSASVL